MFPETMPSICLGCCYCLHLTPASGHCTYSDLLGLLRGADLVFFSFSEVDRVRAWLYLANILSWMPATVIVTACLQSCGVVLQPLIPVAWSSSSMLENPSWVGLFSFYYSVTKSQTWIVKWKITLKPACGIEHIAGLKGVLKKLSTLS